MKRSRRRSLFQFSAAAAASLVLSRVTWAQAYPSRPVRIVVGAGAGGGPDVVTRLLGQWLTKRLGQSFIIDNRPGAGGNIATEGVVRAQPDGYTLLVVGTWNAINATLYPNLGFNFIRDIAPLASVGTVPYVMAVTPSFPAKTVPEFIAYASANPGKISMASPGTGTMPHLAGELFMMMARVEMVHVPYRSLAAALTDLLGGQVQMIFGSLPSTIEYLRSGSLPMLAVTTAARLKPIPDVPTVGEFLPGFEVTGRYGIGAPRDTPVEIVDELNREIGAALADHKLVERFAELGVEPTPMTPTDFAKVLASETEKWSRVVRAANIKVE